MRRKREVLHDFLLGDAEAAEAADAAEEVEGEESDEEVRGVES